MTAPSIDAVSGLVEERVHELRATAKEFGPNWVSGVCKRAADALEAQARDLAAKDALIDRLRLEAQIHSGEARAHKATVHEAYQACSGATGEPGNWHGAQPIKQALATAQSHIAALEDAVRVKDERITQLEDTLRGIAEHPGPFADDAAWCRVEDARTALGEPHDR